MMPIAIFGISGLSICLLLLAKKMGHKKKKYFFVLRIISKGDARIREYYHRLLHLYSEGKEKAVFLLEKQLPIHSKNSKNKLVAYLKRRREQYLASLRDSRLLKKSDGLSEFFQSLSSLEKGHGKIHDTFESGSQNAEEKVK
ncbi:MAG: hypothetical protein WD896_02700 [Parcubacteria group bacterium]